LYEWRVIRPKPEIGKLATQPPGRTPQLETTGGTPFTAEAKVARVGRQHIAPHANQIYESD
jgi:hypothetical protein